MRGRAIVDHRRCGGRARVNLPDAPIDNLLVRSTRGGRGAYEIDSGECAAYRLAFLKSSPPVISGMRYVSANPRYTYARARARARLSADRTANIVQ